MGYLRTLQVMVIVGALLGLGSLTYRVESSIPTPSGPARGLAKIGDVEKFRCPRGTQKIKKCALKRNKENSNFIKSLTDRVLLCREKTGGRAIVVYRYSDPTPQSGLVARYGLVKESQDQSDPGTTSYVLPGDWDAVTLKVYSDAEMAQGRDFNAELVYEQFRYPKKEIVNRDWAAFACN